jgi:hypothetical protein
MKVMFMILLSYGFASAFFDKRDLWTCDAIDCSTCISMTDRQYCSNNNLNGTCCTKTDDRKMCNALTSNCSSMTGFNITNNLAYLVCGFDSAVCGANPSPVPITD